ncbi:hypothetical protein D1F64_21425 [Breoghania sp. L-A4]|nr:hypothetical protein D1F64_21425 [Breoghania sp. L-A4]
MVVTGSGNAVRLIFGDSGIVLPLQRMQIRPPAARRIQQAHHRRRELDILNPALSTIPLIGRTDILDGLRVWLDCDADISVHAVTGRAGSGKTRLAIALCEAVDGETDVGDWAAGFLSPSDVGPVVEASATRALSWDRNTLLVLDYAAQVHGDLARWLDRLATQELETKLRILLLERDAPPGFGWWHELTAPPLNSAAARLTLFYDADLRPHALPGLEDLEGRRAVMTAAFGAARALHDEAVNEGSVPEVGADRHFDGRLAEAQFANPLALVMAGVIAREKGPSEALALRRLEMARHLARRELARLKRLAGEGQAAAIVHLTAFNGLAGGLELKGLNAALADELAAAGLSGDAGSLGPLMQQELPPLQSGEGGGSVGRLGSIQPDLIGEGVIVEALSGAPAIEAGAADVVARAYAVGAYRAAEVLMRLLQDYAYALEDQSATDEEKATARRLMDMLAHVAGQTGNPEALEPLAFALPERTTILREAALDLTSNLAQAFRQAFRNSHNPGDAARAAMWLNNLAFRLSDLGRREDALGAAQEAAGLYRELAAARPDAFTPALAGALNNLAGVLSALGRREDALDAAEEAAGLYRDLAAARPDAFTPDLAMSLNNLASFLSALGRREDALGAAEEAAGLYRDLAAARPDAFTPNLAASLNTLANQLSALGRREAALDAAEEAVGLRRVLAAARPDAFTPNLAASLNNVASFLSALGRREAALDAAEEAVGLRRDLAAARPDAFTPNLAASLNNLANQLSDLGRREDALGAAEEAAGLYRDLAAARPDAFTPDLAMSLNNLASFLLALGRREAALAAAEEAVGLRRDLAAARPDAFTPALAASLSNLAGFLSDLGRREAALDAAQEAAGLFRELAAARPDAFTPDLSVNLCMLSDVRRASSDIVGAREAIAEAIGLLMPLFLDAPQAFIQWMAMHLQRYLELSQELDIEPDMELIGPAVAVFQELQQRENGDDDER